MLKRSMAIVIVCLMLAALASCGGNAKTPSAPPSETPPSGTTSPSSAAPSTAPQTPEAPAIDAKELAYMSYAQIAEQLDSSIEYDIDYNVKMEIIVEGETIPVDMKGNIKMKTVDGKIQYAAVIDMGAQGSFEMYSDGDSAYILMNGEKMDINMSDLMNQVSSSLNVPEFEKDAIKEFSSEEAPSGILTTLVLDGGTLSGFVDEIMRSVLAEFSEDDGLEMDISDIEMEMLADKDGNPLSMVMAMSMRLTVEGETMEMNVEYEYIFNNLGSGVTLELPTFAA